MLRIDLPQIAHALGSAAVVAPLAYAAISKLLDSEAFLRALPRYGLGLPATRLTAGFLALGEVFVAGLGLVLTRWETAALAALAYLIFAVVVWRARRRGASGDCGCFGSFPVSIGLGAVLRNAALGLAACALAVARAVAFVPNYDFSVGLLAIVVIVLVSAAGDTFWFVRRLSPSAHQIQTDGPR